MTEHTLITPRRSLLIGALGTAAAVAVPAFAAAPDAELIHLAEDMVDLRKRYDKAEAAAASSDAAYDVADEIMDKMDAVFDRMTELTATTLEGFRAQAIGLVLNPWCGQIEHPQYQDDFMLVRMMSSLTGIPISPPPEEAEEAGA
jgi:hypothetical protein